MELSRQDYWSGLPSPTPGDLPNPGIKPVSLASPPALAGEFFITAPPSRLMSCCGGTLVLCNSAIRGEGTSAEKGVDVHTAWLLLLPATQHEGKEEDLEILKTEITKWRVINRCVLNRIIYLQWAITLSKWTLNLRGMCFCFQYFVAFCFKCLF